MAGKYFHCIVFFFLFKVFVLHSPTMFVCFMPWFRFMVLKPVDLFGKIMSFTQQCDSRKHCTHQTSATDSSSFLLQHTNIIPLFLLAMLWEVVAADIFRTPEPIACELVIALSSTNESHCQTCNH